VLDQRMLDDGDVAAGNDVGHEPIFRTALWPFPLACA
jgi:hypothetical protein